MTNLKNVELGNLLLYGDIGELEEAKKIIEKEIDSRSKEVYKDCVHSIFVAIDDLIDNGFGHFFAFSSADDDWTWEELKDELEAHFSATR